MALNKTPTPSHTDDAQPAPRERKRAYQRPQLIELGNVMELTRGGGSPAFDGPTKKG